MAGDHVKEITDGNFDQEILKSSLPAIVDFWAEWCGPCKMMSPIVEELAVENEGKVVFGKLDIDSNPQTASQYGINSIPTLLFVKNGTVADQHVGLLAKGPLQAKIDAFIG